MGLDWIAQPTPDGVSPYETLGMKRLNKRDPETVAAFKKIYDSHQGAARSPNAMDSYKQHWTRPFEVVLDEACSEDEPPYVEGTGDVPSFITGGSFAAPQAISFRGKRLGFCGLPDEIVERAHGEGEENVMDPDYALALAEDLHEAIEQKTYGVEGESDDDIRGDIEGAELYLRFWAERGHPIWCWY